MQISTGLHSQLSEARGKSIITWRQQRSGPGTLQDQSCASWSWGQVENRSNNPAGSGAALRSLRPVGAAGEELST